MRTLLQDNPAMTDPAASVYLENHAQTVFVRVDTDERSGRCDRNIALRFRLAMHYIELFRKYEASITRNYEGVEKAAHQQLMSEVSRVRRNVSGLSDILSRWTRNTSTPRGRPRRSPRHCATASRTSRVLTRRRRKSQPTRLQRKQRQKQPRPPPRSPRPLPSPRRPPGRRARQ
jgi:hypothetical protein